MIVISNTSPIINLAAIGRLDLLNSLYGKLIIPQAVFLEITNVDETKAGAKEVKNADWIESRIPTNHALVATLKSELDEGEAEAISLADELKADLLLLDERLGRTVARRLGIRFIGLLGVLVKAKDKGLILAVKPLLDDLILKAGFWIKTDLYDRVLLEVGE